MTHRLGPAPHSFWMVFLCGCLTATGLSLDAAEWRAGLARADITPTDLMWMAGYGGRDHACEGKLTDLWAKALVLDDGAGHRAALITLDLVGIDRELAARICSTIEKRHGLTRDQIAICTSHTHTGPVVGKNLGPMHYYLVDAPQRQLIDRYAERLHDEVVRCVGEAIEALAPSRLAWANGRTTFAVNRRENKEDQVEAIRERGEMLKGPIDHDVPVLVVRGPDDSLRGLIFGYACHATVLPIYQWSGDYPGFCQLELEKRHPGCLALFWAGCGADQNPLPRRTVERAEHYGQMLADAVDAVLAGKLDPVEPRLSTKYSEIPTPLDTLPTEDELKQTAASDSKFEASRARVLLAQIAAGKPLSPTYPYPVGCWRLGEIQWLFLGGEVVVDYSLRLKSELQGTKTWVAGYANDVMAYIPSRRVLREGGYEGGGSMVYYGLPTRWAPEIEEQIVGESRKLAE